MKTYKRYSSEELATWIPKLIAENKLYRFYLTKAWKHLRAEVLDEQHHECQLCKAKGLAVPCATVHHMQTVKDRPDLALTKGNLIAVCDECHYQIHHGQKNLKKKWDDEKF